MLTVGEIIRINARNYPRREALVCGDTRLTFGELNRRVNSLANALLKMGFVKGDKAAIMLRNMPEYIEILFALAKIGVVAVPLNVMFKGKSLEFLLVSSDPKLLFLEEGTRGQVEDIRNKLAIRDSGYVFVGEDVPPGYVSYEQLASNNCTGEPYVQVEEDDDVVILYTSGTTGNPKGVVLTHRIRILYYYWAILHYGMHFEDVHLINTPLYHNMANFLSIAQLYPGGKVVLMPKFDPEETLRLIERERVTSAFMVPTQFNAIMALEGKSKYDVSSLKWLLNAGALLPARTKSFILDFFKCKLYDMYGLTETGPFTTMRHHLEPQKDKCVGLPYLHMEMRVVDDAGQDVRPGEVGEIIARGPTLLRTYYKNPEAYDAAMPQEGYDLQWWCKYISS